MAHRSKKKLTVLVVDDNVDDLRLYSTILEEEFNCRVYRARTISDVSSHLHGHRTGFDIALVDVHFQINMDNPVYQLGGLHVADLIRKMYENTLLVSFSNQIDKENVKKLSARFKVSINKGSQFRSEFGNVIRRLRDEDHDESESLQCFIVHGHDHSTMRECKNFIQNKLHFREPIILHEKPNDGQTVIEKFEHYALDTNIVFVLITPDDILHSQHSRKRSSLVLRARQNVIFEFGYFMAQLKRSSGKVIPLVKGKVELPSDIAGILYIDITDGIEQAGEQIRNELNALIPTKV
jgi:CheY-like chemotaxis protein